MAVDLQQMYDDKVRQYMTSGGGNDRFIEDFLMAAKYAISEINMYMQLSTTIPVDQDEQIALDETYTPVVSACIDYYLMQQGQKFDATQGKDGYTLKDAEKRKDMMLGLMQMNTTLSVSDDDGDDVIGLGYKQ